MHFFPLSLNSTIFHFNFHHFKISVNVCRKMLRKSGTVVFLLLFLQLLAVENVLGSLNYEGAGAASVGTAARLVRKEERTPVVATEFGSISAVDIDDGTGRRNYHLQFITLEPNALFLPVLLHADMVFYVHTGSGRLSWTEGDEVNKVPLQRGDVYRLKSGTLFYLRSSLEPERPRFRIIAIFANPDEDELQGPFLGPYSSINDLVRGFDKPVLQAAFQVSEEVIEELTSTTDSPAIVHGDQGSRKRFWEEELLFINAFFGMQRFSKQAADNKKKHTKTFNFFKEDPDFESCGGWSKVVTKHDLHALHGSEIGVYMVNLSKGSMMGPHWNPTATEVSVVLDGEGMVQVVCPSALTNKDCKNTKIRVEEGDVFAVPRFHPMAQTSFNNGSLVFMGFSTTSKKNHPQFLVGKTSVLQTLDKLVLAASFSVSNTTVDHLLASQDESIILECTSCAEDQEVVMEAEIERERQEERRKEEEEARRREEEQRREEEEERKRQEEEQRKREEEERKREEEEEEEEERKRQEEEEERKRQEEEERKHKEDERKRREEEEERKRQEEEEEERKRQEEEERKRQEEEEERKRQEEEERQRQQEQEEERKREEEERKREEEERRRQEEEEEQKRQEQEEEQRRRQQEEEQRKREEEERRRQEEEEVQRQHEQEEEQRRRQQEEEQKRREEKQARQQEEEERRREEEEARQQEEQQRRQEEEEARQQEEEEEQRRQEKQEKKEKQRQWEEEREEELQREEQRREQEEEQRRQEEEEQEGERGEEESEREEQRRHEEEKGGGEERGRGEEESEGEIARREEEERVERQREQEETGQRWRYVKLKSNRKGRANQVKSEQGGHWREANSDFSKGQGDRFSRIVLKALNGPW